MRSEFSDNVQAVQAEAEASLSRFLEQIAGMNRLAALYESAAREFADVDLQYASGMASAKRLDL